LRSLASPSLALIFIVVKQITLFIRHTKYDLVILVVYVDDFLLIGSDSTSLVETKDYLRRHFTTKDIGKPKYFLEIEVTHKKHSALLSQRKYALDLHEKIGLLGCKLASTPMEVKVNL